MVFTMEIKRDTFSLSSQVLHSADVMICVKQWKAMFEYPSSISQQDLPLMASPCKLHVYAPIYTWGLAFMFWMVFLDPLYLNMLRTSEKTD